MWVLFQILFENHDISGRVGFPPDSDQLESFRDGDVEHGPMLVLAFESEHVVVVFRSQSDLRLNELRGHAQAARFGKNAAKPGEIRGRHHLESDDEPQWLLVDDRHEHADVVSALKPPAEELFVLLGSEHPVVKVGDQPDFPRTDGDDFRIGHDYPSSAITTSHSATITPKDRRDHPGPPNP